MKISNCSSIAVLSLLAPAVVMGGEGDADPDFGGWVLGAFGWNFDVVNFFGGPLLGVVGVKYDLNVADVAGMFLDIASVIPEVPTYEGLVEQLCDILTRKISNKGGDTGLACTCEKTKPSSAVAISVAVECIASNEVCLTTEPSFCGFPHSETTLNLDFGKSKIFDSIFVVTAKPSNFCITKGTGVYEPVSSESGEEVCVDFPLEIKTDQGGDFGQAALSVNGESRVTYFKDGDKARCEKPTVPCGTDPLSFQLDCSEVGGPTSTCKTMFFEDATARRSLSDDNKIHSDTILDSIKKESNQDFYIA